MKRCWFGLGLLIVLLVGGLLATRVMIRNHERLSSRLDLAAAAASAGDWAAAEEQFHSARREWDENWHFSAAFADHEPMENIDGAFSQGEVYLRSQNEEALAAVCTLLSRLTAAMGEAHALNWWNLL